MDEFLKNLWDYMMKTIPTFEGVRWSGVHFSTNDDEILCDDEDATEIIADFLEHLGYVIHTGYYDPVQDERDGCVDGNTGWHYIEVEE